jgi:hypothetical protein
MAHCTECEYRERLRRIKALPAEALRRITALERSITISDDDLAGIGFALHKWVYEEKSEHHKFGNEQMVKLYREQTGALVCLVKALHKYKTHVKLF